MSALTAIMVDALPFVILTLHFVDKWYLSKGRLWQVYILTIVSSVCTVAFNYTLWLAMNGKHNGVLVFTVNSAWTIAMAVKGIARLVGEARTKRLPALPMVPPMLPAKFDTENKQSSLTK